MRLLHQPFTFTTNKNQQAESHRRVETMLRSQCVDLGLKIAVATAPLPGAVIKQYAIPNTVSQAWYIGRAIHRARKSKSNFIDAIVSRAHTHHKCRTWIHLTGTTRQQ